MPAQLSKLLMNDSFVRFLKGKASEEEEAHWNDWKQKSNRNAQLVLKGRKLLNKGVQTLPKPNSDADFNRLLTRIESSDQKQSFNQTRNNSRKIVWASMAASICLLLFTGYLARSYFLKNSSAVESRFAAIEYRVIETETGQKTTVQYSDNSKITINANSKLRIPIRMIESDTMQVWLEGEALFNITKKEKPESRKFIVHTPDGKISVLGTKFSVNTTREQSEVVLAEGSVRISVQNEADKNPSEYLMSPGEKALFNYNFDKILVEKVNTEVYTSWAGNNLVLDNTPLSVLINRIEFTYDVKVSVEDEKLLNKKLTGRFNISNLNFLLKGLSKMLDVDIDQQKQAVTIKEKTISSNTE